MPTDFDMQEPTVYGRLCAALDLLNTHPGRLHLSGLSDHDMVLLSVARNSIIAVMGNLEARLVTPVERISDFA